jgi:hypothetical protein
MIASSWKNCSREGRSIRNINTHISDRILSFDCALHIYRKHLTLSILMLSLVLVFELHALKFLS